MFYRMWWQRQIQRWLSGSREPKRSRATRRPRFRPSLEALEDRLTPSTIPPITITTDSNTAGAGSLRDAVIAANRDTSSGPGTDVRKEKGSGLNGVRLSRIFLWW
jgi:hypothetical protein